MKDSILIQQKYDALLEEHKALENRHARLQEAASASGSKKEEKLKAQISDLKKEHKAEMSVLADKADAALKEAEDQIATLSRELKGYQTTYGELVSTPKEAKHTKR